MSWHFKLLGRLGLWPHCIHLLWFMLRECEASIVPKGRPSFIYPEIPSKLRGQNLECPFQMLPCGCIIGTRQPPSSNSSVVVHNQKQGGMRHEPTQGKHQWKAGIREDSLVQLPAMRILQVSELYHLPLGQMNLNTPHGTTQTAKRWSV